LTQKHKLLWLNPIAMPFTEPYLVPSQKNSLLKKTFQHKKSAILVGHFFYFLLFTFSFADVKAQDKSLSKVPVPSFKKDTFNIKSFGSIADGITLNTNAIKRAIETCSKEGGGVVLVPQGLWLTGPIELKSNVNLSVVKGAVLQFTSDFSQYKLVAGNWEGQPNARNQSPISAEGATNIAITGSGIVDGNGDAWRAVKKDKLTETQWKGKLASGGFLSKDKKTWYPSEKSLKGATTKDAGVLKDGKKPSDFEEIKDFLRPNLVVLNGCKNVLLEGVTFQNSPAWNLHPLLCENLTVRNVYAKNPWYAQNGDGIDVESCNNVLLENSTFDVGDDGICIKSGRDEAGRKRGKPTENMTVRNCVVYHAHGGFVIGSEMSGGVKNLYVSNCSFIGTDVGLRFKTARGRGGVVENIFVSDIVMKDIAGEAILFDEYYMAKDPVPLAGETREPPAIEAQPVNDGTPQFKNFLIQNVVCNGAEKAIFIRGLPEMQVQNIVLQNMVLKSNKGIECIEAQNIVFNNIKLISADTSPLVFVQNSSNIVFDKLVYENADVLFALSGERLKAVAVSNTTITNAKQATTFSHGATEAVFKMNKK
jgi:polygalacturonase